MAFTTLTAKDRSATIGRWVDAGMSDTSVMLTIFLKGEISMGGVSWQVRGDYFESCNCDFLCPCVVSNLSAKPTYEVCDVALAFHIDEGHYGNMALNGLNFAVFMHSPGAMGEGNITVGIVTDARATPEQQQALVGIASGQAGGPMAALAPLVGSVAGVEAKPIEFHRQELRYSVSIPDMLDQAVEGVTGANPNEPLYVDNTIHPVNPRLALAKATRTHMHAFGMDYDSHNGQNNGHFAPFNWRN